MSIWNNKARGLWVDASATVTAASLRGYDFLIAKHGTAFTSNVQAAYDAGVPCILFYEANPSAWWDLDEAHWPDDQSKQLKDIINDVMSGSTRRAVHGVMIDGSKLYDDKKSKYTGAWIKTNTAHLLARVWANLKLPCYLYLNNNPVIAWNTSPTDKEMLFQLVLHRAA